MNLHLSHRPRLIFANGISVTDGAVILDRQTRRQHPLAQLGCTSGFKLVAEKGAGE
ncbi:hypothetical protein SAMN05216316_3174 [Nitrosovibrio sp. Nv6]|nr:hypothetical protein SAMN05216316_3174 [Nitrosovibrio sp. Nv6]